MNTKLGYQNSLSKISFQIPSTKLKLFRFQTFADLFTRCPFAIQTQHPGFYYQEAAYQSMARKQLAQTTCQRLENPDLDTSEFLKGTEFYGQRPWRQHHQSNSIELFSEHLV